LREGGGQARLTSILIEMRCPTHGFERFRVKLIKRFNIASDEIIPKPRRKPTLDEIGLLYVGRNVSYDEAKNYLLSYFRERGMLEEIVRIRMLR
jgi:hypothetical protein